MSMFFSTALIGLGLSAQYALLALGFTMIFGIIGVMNFAHGAFYALGGYVAYSMVSFFSWPYWLAVVAAALVTAALGSLFELVFIERRVNDELATLMLTLGLSSIITTGLVVKFGSESPQFAFPVEGVLDFAGLMLPLSSLVVIGVCALIIVGVWVLMYRSNFGRSLRALSSDREVAGTLGLRAKLLFPLAFGVATGLAGVTGALVTPILALEPHIGDRVLATSFIVVILGGLGSLWGGVAAAVLVGMVEAYSSVYVGGSRGSLILFMLVLLILVFKPSGLFGREVRGA
ncbi:branched-chain amino acid ABC transporter permease [Diaphorobacter sp. HDW4A]|uniref:branched-chain amino acid ABC transporter permease n=1 Tax=Diaphorobacter sp. HDW4A TaxID=2714924 RepID=UPI00140AB431|nr:branched-chain amino acid ABC transporter permease [Diaphorobacter sp. HDW4A]QIL80187.1 branched-chain amino acid ABC transporter permease [Diaphorobacter sp. HDW4A]